MIAEGPEIVKTKTFFLLLTVSQDRSLSLEDYVTSFSTISLPFFAAPLSEIMNLSLSSSVVPKQWKLASILPIPKVTTPHFPSDYRPISNTSVISRILERIVVRDYIYPSLRTPPSSLIFTDQFAFQPTASTTAALIYLLHTITSLLETNPYVVVLAIDFSKAFDGVRHSAVHDKYSRMNIPDNIYNWVASFFQDHLHSTRFDGQVSALKAISASIIQGSVIGPVSYVITASDLQPSSPANFIVKYADDTYMIIPAGNISSGPAELTNTSSVGT